MTLPARHITAPIGFRAAGGICGIKASGLPDLTLIVSDTPAQCATVFTQNAIVGAPVMVGRRHVARGKMRAFVCNSGIANVATGQRGIDNALAMCMAVAQSIECNSGQVLPFSTGVIGQQLPIAKITRGITELASQLAQNKKADAAAAKAIMTTDTRPKAAVRKIKIGGKTVTLGGIAKGSGMISPNMATMFGLITTDAHIAAPALRSALKQAVNADGSFNRISVDSDTSTSDTVAVMANGRADNPVIRGQSQAMTQFTDALTQLCQALAYQVIADGEGLEHVIRVKVTGAQNQADALKVARSVADSPLVKTAVHGGDPNWGRLAMAVGKSGAAVNPTKLTMAIGPTVVFRHGEPAKFTVTRVIKTLKAFEVVLALDLGIGDGSCEFLGCDLSREYIAINADYHT